MTQHKQLTDSKTKT